MNWHHGPDDSYTAEEGEYRAEVYHDYDSGAPDDNDWAYRVSGPDGDIDSGACDSPEDGQSICEKMIAGDPQ